MGNVVAQDGVILGHLRPQIGMLAPTIGRSFLKLGQVLCPPLNS
jgi:hypothetical protein